MSILSQIGSDFLGLKTSLSQQGIINPEKFSELLLRFGFHFLVTVIIVRYLYYYATRRKDYLFTYVLISTTVFLLCFMLGNVELQLGFALGLFAIFGIIRYRTTAISIKEMTYLFIIIGLAVINALTNKVVSYAELFFTNFVIIIIIWVLERLWLSNNISEKTITYDKLDHIKPADRELLIKDLEELTGLNIKRIEIGRINFLRNTARIKIYYVIDKNGMNYADFEDQLNDANDDDDGTD